MSVGLQTFCTGVSTRRALNAARMFEQGAHNNDGKETPDHDTGRECGECQQQDVTSEKAQISVQTRSDRRDVVRRRNVISGSTGYNSGEVLEPLPAQGSGWATLRTHQWCWRHHRRKSHRRGSF